MKDRLESFDKLLEFNVISEDDAIRWAKEGYEVVSDLNKINACHVKSSYPVVLEHLFVLRYDATQASTDLEDEDDDEYPTFI